MTTAIQPRVAPGEVGADRPPATLAEASLLGPYDLLVQLREQSLHNQVTPVRSAGQLLAELALAAAVQHTWLRLQPINVHLALVAGATVPQVAAALGSRPAAAGEAWLRWARRQAAGAERDRCPGPLVTREQITAVVERHPDIWPGGTPS